MADETSVRMIDDVSAFKKSCAKSAPVFTMRPRLPSSNDMKNKLQTEPAKVGDLKKELEASKLPRQPCFSMGVREAGLLPPPFQPGPGQYRLESTLGKSHPTERLSGRGWSWGATARHEADRKQSKGPGPMAYRVNSEPAFRKSPQFSIGVKRKDTSDKAIRPSCQTYKVDKILRDGPQFSPAWSLGKRVTGSNSSEEESKKEPGPGSFAPHIEANGRRDRAPKWGFYSRERWKTPKGGREPPY